MCAFTECSSTSTQDWILLCAFLRAYPSTGINMSLTVAKKVLQALSSLPLHALLLFIQLLVCCSTCKWQAHAAHSAEHSCCLWCMATIDHFYLCHHHCRINIQWQTRSAWSDTPEWDCTCCLGLPMMHQKWRRVCCQSDHDITNFSDVIEMDFKDVISLKATNNCTCCNRGQGEKHECNLGATI